MGATNDVFQLIDVQNQEGQQILNVYYWRQDALTAGNGAEQLVTSFIDQFLPDVLAVQTVDVTHTSVSAKNLYNPSEEYTELISETGALTSAALPTFNAVGFQLVGDNASVRDGAKRIAGVTEEGQGDGTIVDATILSALTALAVTMATGLDVGLATELFSPVIVKRILDGGNYRLPTSQAEDTISKITSALFNPRVTSQTSRKFGVGA